MAFSIMNAALPATEMRRGAAGSVTVRPPASTTTMAPAAGAAAAGAEDFPQAAQRQAAAMAATNPGIRMNFMDNSVVASRSGPARRPQERTPGRPVDHLRRRRR